MSDETSSDALVVVVDDDQSVREMLCAVLANEGYQVRGHADGEAALKDRDVIEAHGVILDVGLPGRDGFQVCRQLRELGRANPILLLTARHEVADRVNGLDAGADDYLVKPFALDELFARVRAMIRRAHPSGASMGGATATNSTVESVQLGDLAIDTASREVRRGGHLVSLTKIEFELLLLLVSNSPTVLSRDLIHERIWGYSQEHGSNTLEVFISQLRRKLSSHSEATTIIHTVRGVGYVARNHQ